MPLVLQAVHSPPDSCSCSKWDLSFRDAHSHSPQERGGGARTEQRLLRPSLSALRTRAEAMTGGRWTSLGLGLASPSARRGGRPWPCTSQRWRRGQRKPGAVSVGSGTERPSDPAVPGPADGEQASSQTSWETGTGPSRGRR